MTSNPPESDDNSIRPSSLSVPSLWVTNDEGDQAQFKRDGEAWYQKKSDYLIMGQVPEIMIRPWKEVKDRPFEGNTE